jgi:arylsulfatase
LTRDTLFFSHENNRALRVGNYKLVSAKIDGGNAWQLYDLSTDRGEQNNLATAQPQRLQEMIERWTALDEQFKKDTGLPLIIE